MCEECGCSLPGDEPVRISAHPHEHEHEHPHAHNRPHPHDHEHPHEHPHTHDGHEHTHPHNHDHGDSGHHHDHAAGERRSIEVRQAILEKNDRLAERNRGFFRARGFLTLNVLSSPGSGKTTLIRETVRALKGRFKAGVIVGDLATDNDAQRLRESGAPVVQITTGTVCHLEAEMVARAVKQLDLNGLDLLIIENVGNLVCPASYDLGEDLRVVLLSVTEGEDKPLKYPPMFQGADVALITKMDLAEPCAFDRQAVLANLQRLTPKARVFEVSSKTGQGLDAWCQFLAEQHQLRKTLDPLSA